MWTSVLSAALLCGPMAVCGFGQTDAPGQTSASYADYVISASFVLQPPTRAYQKFFDEVKDLVVKRPVSVGARAALHLTDQELRSLLAITADLATESRTFDKAARSVLFESRMEVVESEVISPSTQEKLRALENQWAEIILTHVQRLKTALGASRFLPLDEFIRSGKSMFDNPEGIVTRQP